ncbi:MAG TPA: fumarylacetoacetate hydrolase family protein [Mycobacteriales bacterium]|jgi:2-keto-4-pentenoate hydratase/2-oxohepta-3-ene-1,7-dioic acid hydratase in catechol pathway|nr:fumarylacetoacetate hydrolase family protein [Mycobacteriales bacterium]
MRIARFSKDGDVAFAVVEGDELAVLDRHPFGAVTFTGERVPVADVRLLAPMIPSKVVAIGKNYADHAREMGGEAPASPVLFMKPSTAVCGPGDPIQRPAGVERLDFEGELAVVIGRLARDVPVTRALGVVLGYTCANDVTARDQQKTDGQWTRAKGYDTFCPIGPWIETDLDPGDLPIRTTLNGDTRQDSTTALLLHDVPTLISYVTAVMTLLPGDIVLTGTPAGVGPMVAGDEVSVTVEGIGTLTNPVVSRG